MSLNPLNELKRRLEDSSTPMPKRLCLARNLIQTHHFPVAPKERVIGDWLNHITKNNKIKSKEIRDILSWINLVEDLTAEFKNKIIEIVAHYIEVTMLQVEDLNSIQLFLTNEKIVQQLLTNHVSEYLLISKHLIQHLKNDEADHESVKKCEAVLNSYSKYYRECKRKLEFIVKFIQGDNLETIFDCLDNTHLRSTTLTVLRDILFPITRKPFYSTFLQIIIRKDNIDDLVQGKGDNIQSVLKIMSAFFTFPSGRTTKDPKFLIKFIDTFVSSYKTESQLIFAFYVMVINSLHLPQSYLCPAMIMPVINFEENNEKVKRNVFLNMLQSLLHHDVNINVNLIDSIGEKSTKVDVKKNFTALIQTVLLGQIKLKGKPDKSTLEIITLALKLDPILIEQKMEQILPPLMISKKNNSNVINAYTYMLEVLLDTLFKLSRGTLFLNQMLPRIKLLLEARNTEQFELKMNEQSNEGGDSVATSKQIEGEDIFPQKCVDKYGMLSTQVMFRQNCEQLISLQSDFENHCLIMLGEGFVSPSVIIMAEVISAVLQSFFENCKMADHTVPQVVAEEFWTAFQKFEVDVIKKFGKCLLKLSPDPRLTRSFLKLCVGFAELKVLNLQYSYCKLDNTNEQMSKDIFDLTILLPCLKSEQWNEIGQRTNDVQTSIIFDKLLTLKIVAHDLLNTQTKDNIEMASTRSYLIEEISKNPTVVYSCSHLLTVLLSNLNSKQTKQFTKSILKVLAVAPDLAILEDDAILNNKTVLSLFVDEILKNLMRVIQKATSNTCDLDSNVDRQNNFKEYLDSISGNVEFDDNELVSVTTYMDFLKQLKVYNLNNEKLENTIFILLALKKAINKKKVRKSIDALILLMFESSSKYPDIYNILPVEYVFGFPTNFLDLATLNIKSANSLAIVKIILQTAVKKVKTDSDVVKKVVKILLSNQKNNHGSSIDYFSNDVFQITCTLLPLISKEKKAITTSAYRSILADLQEKLHKSLLQSLKNIDFGHEQSRVLQESGSTGALNETALATMNAMEAYSLTVSKYCETNGEEDIRNLDCLWSGLEYFVKHAIISIKTSESKLQHVQSSIQLINVMLRYIHKLGSHNLFQDKDKLFLEIWQSAKERLHVIFSGDKNMRSNCLDDIAVMLKYLFELASVNCFVTHFVADFDVLTHLKKPSTIHKEAEMKGKTYISHTVAKYLWTSCLKSNIVGPKCVAISKSMHRTCKNMTLWLHEHYYAKQRETSKVVNVKDEDSDLTVAADIKVEDSICSLLVIDLDILSEVILAGKKTSLNNKFLDAIFQIENISLFILNGGNTYRPCQISWDSFFCLFRSCLTILNNMLISREELLEDRWPCYLQCYRTLVLSLCQRSSSQLELERDVEERLSELSHSVEKLTQAVSKRKAQISRLAAYTVADICGWLETTAPTRLIRQHLENCVSLLIQVSDSTYSMAFLRRALAGSPGHMTMTNLYSMYKRYHKYVGNT